MLMHQLFLATYTKNTVGDGNNSSGKSGIFVVEGRGLKWNLYNGYDICSFIYWIFKVIEKIMWAYDEDVSMKDMQISSPYIRNVLKI